MDSNSNSSSTESHATHASSEESFEKEKKRKPECSRPNTSMISNTERMIPFVSDFPKNCVSWKIFATQCSQYSDQSDSSSSSSFYYSSESEDSVGPLVDNALESVSSKEVARKDVLQALDAINLIDLLKTSDYEAKELTEKAVSKFMPKGYKPHKRALAIRDYPVPPGRFQTPLSNDLVQTKVADSSPSYDSEVADLMVLFPANGLESMKSAKEVIPKALDDIKLIDLEETSEHEAKELSKESELSSPRHDSESRNSIISMYNISLNSFGLSSSSDEGINMPKVIDPMGLIQSETSEHKDTDLTEEITSKLMPQILPPNTMDSTTTYLPKGCKRRGPQIREEATTSETKTLIHDKLSDAEDPLLEVPRSCSISSCRSNLKKSEHLSCHCSNQSLEKGPSTEENQVHKGMAAPNCPLTQKKTASRSKSTRKTNKRKRKKH